MLHWDWLILRLFHDMSHICSVRFSFSVSSTLFWASNCSFFSLRLWFSAVRFITCFSNRIESHVRSHHTCFFLMDCLKKRCIHCYYRILLIIVSQITYTQILCEIISVLHLFLWKVDSKDKKLITKILHVVKIVFIKMYLLLFSLQ